MIKVITYGTFDMLHYGHVKLLERAKALGDYLIVGITSDDYDKTRGKINNSQSLMERIAAVRETGLADEIIVEEYEGQKIDDIQKYNIDIFTEGSDWEGYFDYLNEYCKVIYLPRTEGISSSEVRTNNRRIRIGIVGCTRYLNKFINESKYVNGADVTAVYYQSSDYDCKVEDLCTDSYKSLLEKVDAVYIISRPENHYKDVKTALLEGKHVLCESPISYTRKECEELFEIARTENLILMDAIKTAYSTPYE
ncbi:MAG: adenylyltransferase/cytidyltransferase family protein, partial [Erysipelotrichaceae bacterium]|nr:adenylyltransferase/cytidyltransferase family protein [Erysipelotrichaceae bacterium]